MTNYVKVPTIYQMEMTECGAASLSMIFAYFGKFVPLEKMRIETGVSREGCNAANLLRAAKRAGLSCKGFHYEPDRLPSLKMPCILHWNFNHFVVLEGFKKGYAFINDPAVGRRKITLEELDEAFTGIVLTFDLTQEFKKEKQANTLFAFLMDRIRGYFSVIFKLFYIGLLLVFPGLVLPVLSQIFMDDILGNGYTDWLTKLLVFMALTIIMKLGLTYYRQELMQKLQLKLSVLSGFGLLKHLFHLPIAFFNQRAAGDICSRVNDNTEVSKFLAGDLGETVLNIFVASFYLILLFLYSPILTLIGLCCMGINIGIMAYSARIIGDKSMKLEMDSGKLAGVVYAGIGISSTLKAAGAEQAYTSRILGYQAKASNQEQKISAIQNTIDAIPNAISQLAEILILFAGGLLAMKGKLTIGMLVAFSSLFSSFSDPFEAMVGFVKKVKVIKSNMIRVDDIMRYPVDELYSSSSSGKTITSKLNGTVQLKQVSFGYIPLKPPIISDFNLKIDQGRSVAIVGASGCGKTTISKLIGGLYHPWSGSILFDGVDLLSIPEEVRSVSIATVSQNIIIFAGSVRDNLKLWNPAILDSDMIAAAKDACIHDTIMAKSGGYDYMLTEGAKNLSGGQKQRLEIARALSVNPSILILDEATSALDPITEKAVMDNIKRRNCTCIVVAHRLSAIRDCDEILVMHRGRIIERGSHGELIQLNGHYKNIVQSI